jgi:peptide-methionine (S)-S-oxide reductase
MSGTNATATATFGAGCFWGVEEAFRQVPGVVATAVGYMGGHVPEPTYRQVCTDRTGHAEVVQVTYDPARVSFERLLEVFFTVHDPTQLNRQGPDVGRQYRSVVFAHDAAQHAAAAAAKAALDANGRWRRPVVTEIVPADGHPFWRAEEYHQQYVQKNGGHGCGL